ncbi:GDSL-type esterase/lipase family protein [Bacillus suaedae]|uniref:SGNH hydrolase-type esterase domain-containing protein n=1 Tax=Halalkalibacter suaedae TaxID=2822140 RepID=A0A940WYT4_9BACI|nr:GDSL-type esterase/lipase family protein [Bacillus suaedae]MBP3951021.1 hypothetical protein [Bacillus suaedae]
MHYTALGDSLTVGIGDSLGGFVNRSATILRHSGIPVKVQKIAKVGLTSQELLVSLQNPRTRLAIARADLITLTIGGNDLLKALEYVERTKDPSQLEMTISKFSVNLNKILQQIQLIKSATPTKNYQIRIIGLYNPVPHIPLSTAVIKKINRIICSYRSATIRCVDIYNHFSQPGSLARDLHPNAVGYQAITKQLLNSI